MSNGIPTKVADAEIAENQQQIQQRQKTSIGHKARAKYNKTI
jgi:hypothetical protein